MSFAPFQIFAKTLTGQTHTLDVTGETTVYGLKLLLQQRMHKSPDRLRVIFAGKQLEDGRTLNQQGILQHSTLHIVERLAGDIGVFDLHSETIHIQFLVESEISSEEKDIHELVESLGGNQEAKYFLTDSQFPEELLNELVKFADHKYKQALDSNLQKEEVDDLKIYLTKEQAINLMGQVYFSKLETCFDENYSDIILRRSQAHGKLINFHTDVSLKTLQLCLNDDSQYVGGRLLFATQGKLEIPQRKRGALTVHNNQIVHGVTLFESGTRYGLFLLNKA